MLYPALDVLYAKAVLPMRITQLLLLLMFVKQEWLRALW